MKITITITIYPQVQVTEPSTVRITFVTV